MKNRYQKMDQRTKKRDIAGALPPVKQQDIDKKRGIVIEKEQQEENASIGEEEEAESDRGGGEPQAAIRKKQRGKYRQYEDSQVIVEKIRVYRTQRYPDSEIMKLLDNIPRRRYYSHLKKLQEQDRQIMEQWMSENVEQVSEELMIYRETLC